MAGNVELALSIREGVQFDLIAHLRRQRAFSRATFGPGPRTKGVLDHIRKELGEIERKPDDLMEWVDVILLALDGAWRAGHAPEAIATAIDAKQGKNELRDWPDWRTADPNKAIEHVRAAAAADVTECVALTSKLCESRRGDCPSPYLCRAHCIADPGWAGDEGSGP